MHSTPVSSTEIHDERLTALRMLGDGDAALGIDRAARDLLAAMVDRQKAFDSIEADLKARRDKARIAHDKQLALIRTKRTNDLGAAATAHATALEVAVIERDDRISRVTESAEKRVEELTRMPTMGGSSVAISLGLRRDMGGDSVA